MSMIEEALDQMRAVIRDELTGGSFRASVRHVLREEMMGEPFREAVRGVVREHIAPLEEGIQAGFRRMDGRIESEVGSLRREMLAGFERVTKAILYLANCGPGTVPGQKSHQAQELEEMLT